jgi:hypothetical protein
MSDCIFDVKKRNYPISLGFGSRTIQEERMAPPDKKKNNIKAKENSQL